MTHASLFTGIGGFDLAALWMGWNNVFQCEIDPFCIKLLKQNFPNTIKYGNIKETGFSAHKGTIDVLSGGFPCQPYSAAGKRLGKEDERHLWPEKLRAIREIQPGWVVGENVRGLTNWNGGLVFDEVQADLEAEGYEVLPFLLPAAGVNAPHRRDRIFFIAYSNGVRANRRTKDSDQQNEIQQERGRMDGETTRYGTQRITSNTNTNQCKAGIEKHEQSRASIITNDCRISSNSNSQHGFQGGVYATGSKEAERFSRWSNACPAGNWEDFPTQSGICRRDDGIPKRVDRVKALGNAVVPQVVFQIFKAIEQFENLLL